MENKNFDIEEMAKSVGISVVDLKVKLGIPLTAEERKIYDFNHHVPTEEEKRHKKEWDKIYSKITHLEYYCEEHPTFSKRACKNRINRWSLQLVRISKTIEEFMNVKNHCQGGEAYDIAIREIARLSGFKG